MRVHFDFETFSEADIKKVGTWAYSRHPSTEILCMAYNINGEKTKLWLPDKPIPQFLHPDNHRHYEYYAWNSFFEYCIIKHLLGIEPPPLENWYDPSAHAAAHSLPKNLGKCGQAMGLPSDQQKDKRGKYLIQKLCKPYRGKRTTDPVLMEELHQYCIQDVEAEMAINDKLKPLSPTERNVWLLDQAINLRGVQIDFANVLNGIDLLDKETARLNQEVKEITNGELSNVSQIAKVKKFIVSLGCKLDKFDKAYLAKVVKLPDLNPVAKRLIEIRQLTGKTSLAKYGALKSIIDPEDKRARGILLYHGASTGRWSGRLFQPQNLPRPSFDDTDNCISLFAERNPEAINMIYGEPLEALSSCIRGMICASPGYRLIASDYSAIEARVLAWLAGQRDVVDIFKGDGRLYEHAAAQIYGVSIDKVTPKQRFIGKIASLACGYQGSKNAFKSMAETYGENIDERTAMEVVGNWRQANIHIVQFWSEINLAAISAVKHPGRVFRYRHIAFRIVEGDLYCKLPSGRMIVYNSPTIGEGNWGNDQLEYMGQNSVTQKYEKTNTYGGKLVENITQAVARDIMAHAMLKLEAKGYKIVLTVHDEIITEAPEGFGSLSELERIMCDLPEWASGLPIEASGGYESFRYRK
jgi:DNA polymerase